MDQDFRAWGILKENGALKTEGIYWEYFLTALQYLSIIKFTEKLGPKVSWSWEGQRWAVWRKNPLVVKDSLVNQLSEVNLWLTNSAMLKHWSEGDRQGVKVGFSKKILSS